MSGEQNWKRVLFDTNVVAAWLAGDTEFQAPLKGAFPVEKKATFNISAVTVQELMVFAGVTRTDSKAHAFLTQTFATLPFDERAAHEAARIGASRPALRGAKQPERDL